MNTTMNLKSRNYDGFDRAVANVQGFGFRVHIFDKSRKRIAVRVGLHF